MDSQQTVEMGRGAPEIRNIHTKPFISKKKKNVHNHQENTPKNIQSLEDISNSSRTHFTHPTHVKLQSLFLDRIHSSLTTTSREKATAPDLAA